MIILTATFDSGKPAHLEAEPTDSDERIQAAIDAFVRTVERRSRHRVLWLAHGGLERIRALFAANG